MQLSDGEDQQARGPIPDLADEVSQLMDEFERPLLRYCTRLLRSPELAQDAVQDVFLRYVQHRRGGQAEIKNRKAWLYRVAHNLALDHIRRNRRGEAVTEELAYVAGGDHASGPAEILARKDAEAEAWEILRELPEREQRIVLLKVVDEKSYKEIASIMGLTPTNVGFILHTAFKKLGKRLRQRLA